MIMKTIWPAALTLPYGVRLDASKRYNTVKDTMSGALQYIRFSATHVYSIRFSKLLLKIKELFLLMEWGDLDHGPGKRGPLFL